MTEKELHRYVLDWIDWRRTRRYYLTPPAKNILARLQPGPVGEAPDANNLPDMQFFNSAVQVLAAMPEHEKQWACFKFCYLESCKHVKQITSTLKICRRSYYNYVTAFARAAVSMSFSLKSAHAAMMAHTDERSAVEID